MPAAPRVGHEGERAPVRGESGLRGSRLTRRREGGLSRREDGETGHRGRRGLRAPDPKENRETAQEREEKKTGGYPGGSLTVLPALSARTSGSRDLRLRPSLQNPAKLHTDVVRRLPALLRVLGQAGLHEAVERGRRHRLDRRDRFRLALEDRGDERRLALAGECSAPR